MADLPNYLVCPGCHNDSGFHKHPEAPRTSNTAICEECGNRVLYQPDEERMVGKTVYIIEHFVRYEGVIDVKGPFVSLQRARKNGVPDETYLRGDHMDDDEESTAEVWAVEGRRNSGYTIKQRTLR